MSATPTASKSVASSARTGGQGSGSKSLLVAFLNKRVTVITNDGRVVTGKLLGFDQVSNLVMGDCVERIFSSTRGTESLERGVHVLRGDNIAVVGEVDDEIDGRITWGDVRVGSDRFLD